MKKLKAMPGAIGPHFTVLVKDANDRSFIYLIGKQGLRYNIEEDSWEWIPGLPKNFIITRDTVCVNYRNKAVFAFEL